MVGRNEPRPVGAKVVEVLDDRRRLRKDEVCGLVAEHGDAGHRPQGGGEFRTGVSVIDEVCAEREVELV